MNPIPLVPEKNQGLYPFGISWICYWNTHVNTRLNMYWGKICTCILFKCYLFKTNFEVSYKLKKPKNNQFRAKVYAKNNIKKKKFLYYSFKRKQLCLNIYVYSVKKLKKKHLRLFLETFCYMLSLP